MANVPSRFDRLTPLDLLRGLCVALMVMDHAVHFLSGGLYAGGETWYGPFPDPEAGAFLLRFLSHPAAPGFALCLGAGLVLFTHNRMAQGWTSFRCASTLAIRGLILVLAQFLLANTAWMLPDFLAGTAPSMFAPYFGVLSMLGVCLALLGPMAMLPSFATAPLGALFISTTATLTIRAPGGGPVDLASSLLYLPGQMGEAFVNYPILPWAGVVLIGMALGRELAARPFTSLRTLLPTGIGLLALFPVLRLWGGMSANLRALPPLESGLTGFLQVVKYPPSPTFLCLTLGLCALLLFTFTRFPRFPGSGLLASLGRAPFLAYILHLWLLAAAQTLLQPLSQTLWLPLLATALCLAVLYPLAKTWDRLKHTRPPTSVWRLF